MRSRFPLSALRSPRLAFSLGCAASLALGCGPEFDRPSDVVGLRVLGVQKDHPYAEPDQAVELSLLYHDGVAGEATPPRPISIAWLTGCWNPPADSYAGCFLQFASGDIAGVSLEYGNRVSILTKAAPIQPRPAPSPDYDLGYVFFAACAGTISLDAEAREGLPIRCRDESGRDLGSRDFVVGYTAIYVFAERSDGMPYQNANPAVTGFSLQGRALAGELGCVGESCLASCSDRSCEQRPVPPPACEAEGAPCLPRCEADGDAVDCPGYDIRPLYSLVEPAELDQVSNDSYGRANTEQMWINYYTTRGAVKSDARLLNDATTQYNENFGTEFYAPSTPGPVRVWAVVHDNRGGVSWAGATLYIQ
jgi:hypothetical protein